MQVNLAEIINDWSDENMVSQLQTLGTTIKIEIPYQYLGCAQSSIDVAHDHLIMSFALEELSTAGTTKSFKVDKSKYPYKTILELECINFDLLADKIDQIAPLFSGDPDSFEIDHANAMLEEYSEDLDTRSFRFPEIADDYYANLIYGANVEIASDLNSRERKTFFSKIYKKYPEQQFGYWRSAASNSTNGDFYVSRDGWIVPKRSNLDNILNEYSGFEHKLIFEDAELFENKGDHYILTNNYTVRKDHHILNPFYFCSRSALAQKYNIDSFKVEYPNKFKISEFGAVLIAENSFFYYIQFYPALLGHTELKHLLASMMPIYDKLKSLTGLVSDITRDWNKLDDDKFEELCYDIIYYSEKFDSSTIRKMGKSRSRDGGRDIEVQTNTVLGRGRLKYIFQCKLIRDGSSLTSSKLSSSSNTIMQYGAAGYGIFTSGVVDSAVYDMLDGFKRNFSIEIEVWSVYEIERYLARMPDIKSRYF